MDINEKELISMILSDDIEAANNSWEELYKEYEVFIERIVNEHLFLSYCSPKEAEKYRKILRRAGWQGFSEAIQKYKSDGESFVSLANNCIQERMIKAYDCLPVNAHMIAMKNSVVIGSIAWMSRVDNADSNYYPVIPLRLDMHLSKHKAKELGKYSAERLTIQLLTILKKFTDENHSISSEDLYYYLEAYRIIKYGNSSKLEYRNSFHRTIAEILTELGIENFRLDNRDEYLDAISTKEKEPLMVDKASGFDEISYNHLFDNDSLDHIIQIIFFSNTISDEEKKRIVSKLISTSSLYYETPFWDNTKQCFISTYKNESYGNLSQLAANINTIQYAINHLAQISFKYNRYSEKKQWEPESEITVSPYHLIAYHGYYYLVCAEENKCQISHLRVDLMSDVEMDSYSDGIPVPVDVVPFEGMPLFNQNWNKEKYSAEHLYMDNSLPELVHIRVSSKDSAIYTLFYDWFGDDFDVLDDSNDLEKKIITVKTSPKTIIPFALQYSDRIEIIDEAIRSEIREKLSTLNKKYNL